MSLHGSVLVGSGHVGILCWVVLSDLLADRGVSLALHCVAKLLIGKDNWGFK